MSMKFEFPETCSEGAACGCAESDARPVAVAPAPTDVEHATVNVDPVEVGRRWFLKASAAFTTTILAPGVTLMAFGEADSAHAKPADQPVSAKQRWGLLIDAGKCEQGCKACVTACNEENGIATPKNLATDAQWIRTLQVKNPENGSTFQMPFMCQHCSEPPCVDVCPTGASFRRADGIVLVDRHICIGCRYCMMACPYKARSFVHEPLHDQKPEVPRGKGCVESCTMCVHRVDEGGTPACVEACAKTGNAAMIFGDLHDPNSEIAKRIATYRTTRVRADLGTDPGVFYQNI